MGWFTDGSGTPFTTVDGNAPSCPQTVTTPNGSGFWTGTQVVSK